MKKTGFVIYCVMPDVADLPKMKRFCDKFGHDCELDEAEVFNTADKAEIKMRQLNDWSWAIVISVEPLNEL